MMQAGQQWTTDKTRAKAERMAEHEPRVLFSPHEGLKDEVRISI